ncbi:isotrichodermin C-15 hydroxylase [Clohesyomyces aquaticus]|uniref:Isotrichodermin C-15 hydroxylase n=1 Tax=Clohesyomyces aquaticus TaxID=1231657 RepID=A0A1Y1YYX2_9PLEO|nr:isotrichodermin C-15 hydroxylase [Clohesyomyces aquaticus]
MAKVLFAIGVLCIYPIINSIYNLYFHPLSRRFPGPKLWAMSRLPFIYNLLRGTLIQRQREIHERYGKICRIAPDEISFANEQSWDDIYTFRRGHKRAVRDKAFFTAPDEHEVDNIITTTDPKFHMRVRGLLSHSFTEDALRTQYPIINHHANTLVSQLRKLAQTSNSPHQPSVVNMTDWVNFFTMDVIGDLAFGEPFGCLSRGEYHDWVRTLFMYLKFMSIAAAPRYYPWLEWGLMKLIPKSIMEGQRTHQKYADERINKRLELETSRSDFMSAFIKKNHDFSVMSRKELLSTFNFVIIGGSETTATVLTGLFTHLATDWRVRETLCREIRARFKREEDINFDSIKGLPYLEAVLSEGLRMCNPIPSGLPRMVPKGGDTYCGEYLPEGTRIGSRTFAINRSPDYFYESDTFVPERWLPLSERPKQYHNDQLTASRPFSVGFHSCMGKSLAWVELRLVLCRLLWAFDLDNEGLEKVKFDNFPVLMLVQKSKLDLNIKLRDM